MFFQIEYLPHLRLQHLASARASALDIELERLTIAEESVDVLLKDGGVEAIGVEGTANEESASVAEEPAHSQETQEVFTSSNVRL